MYIGVSMPTIITADILSGGMPDETTLTLYGTEYEIVENGSIHLTHTIPVEQALALAREFPGAPSLQESIRDAVAFELDRRRARLDPDEIVDPLDARLGDIESHLAAISDRLDEPLTARVDDGVEMD